MDEWYVNKISVSVSESAAWVEEEEMLGNTEAISFLLFTKWNTEKKRTPNFTKKKKINKKCAYKRKLQHTIRTGCDISAIS